MCECCTLSNTLVAKLGFFDENLATNDKFSQAVLLHNRDFRFHSTLTIDILQFHEKNCHFCGFCLHYFDRLQFHDKNSKLSLLFKLFWPTPISREKFRWYKWVNPGVIFLLAQQEHQDNF